MHVFPNPVTNVVHSEEFINTRVHNRRSKYIGRRAAKNSIISMISYYIKSNPTHVRPMSSVHKVLE